MPRAILAILLSVLTATAALAQSDTILQPPAGDRVAETFAQALRTSIGGPARADIMDQATVRVPADMMFVDRDAAAKILTAMQRPVPEDFAGLLLGSEGMENPGVVRYLPVGFVDANEALAWTSDDFLASQKDTVEAKNAERQQLGYAPLEARRWSIVPHYNPEAHTFVWAAVIIRKAESPETDGETVVRGIGFGRDGYVEIAFTTDERKAEAIGRTVDDFLTGLAFRPGKSYDDAQPGDRKDAAGLAGAMELTSLHKAHAAVSTDNFIPIAGTSVAAIGALAGLFMLSRHLRRESRRG